MSDIVLYILMRTDLTSMSPGKAMAQANHAYGALKKAVRTNMAMQPDYLEWMKQTDQEFGTTIVLGGDQGEIEHVLRMASYAPANMVATWVHDPTYPVKDGAYTHQVPLNTCAIVFGRKEDCSMAVYTLELHP